MLVLRERTQQAISMFSLVILAQRSQLLPYMDAFLPILVARMLRLCGIRRLVWSFKGLWFCLCFDYSYLKILCLIPIISQVTSVDLHRQFHALGVGVIEDVRIQRDKGFGFVRYSSHAEAGRAIQMGNARILFGKAIKCSWGSKPTPPGTGSIPMPPPAAAIMPIGFTAADLAPAYERQLALAKMLYELVFYVFHLNVSLI